MFQTLSDKMMAILAFDFFRNQLKRTGGKEEKNRGEKS